jgi:hypothetical protein
VSWHLLRERHPRAEAPTIGAPPAEARTIASACFSRMAMTSARCHRNFQLTQPRQRMRAIFIGELHAAHAGRLALGQYSKPKVEVESDACLVSFVSQGAHVFERKERIHRALEPVVRRLS